VARTAEHLLCKGEAPSSNPSPTKKKNQFYQLGGLRTCKLLLKIPTNIELKPLLAYCKIFSNIIFVIVTHVIYVYFTDFFLKSYYKSKNLLVIKH
jgi:hypothetical protein